MVYALILIPLLAAGIAWSIQPGINRARILPVTGIIHFVLTVASLTKVFCVSPSAWFRLDPLGGWVLLVVSAVFAMVSFYAPAYLALRPDRNYRIFCVSMLGFLSMASLVATARHPGVLWVGMEAMTLVTTPLIYYTYNRRSLEATWKYLMICSVGMALALLGTFFIAYAADLGGMGEPLYFDIMVESANSFPGQWLKAGFVLLLVGYGTKMGLAPLHTWKPDTYSESPGIVGAVLGAGVTTCAFLCLARMLAILNAAGEGEFARDILVTMGLLSMSWSFVFMVLQTDIKRLLAYSGVEQAGILAIGLGIGGSGTNVSLFLVGAYAAVKVALFLAAGNIQRAFGARTVPEVSGVIRYLPWTGWLFLASFFASACSPPFGPFIGAYRFASTSFASGRVLAGGLFLALLGAIFLASSKIILTVVLGTKGPSPKGTLYGDSIGTVGPIAVALAVALLLGVWMPPSFSNLLDHAATIVRGS
jgi:hydrogenase-4 component F